MWFTIQATIVALIFVCGVSSIALLLTKIILKRMEKKK